MASNRAYCYVDLIGAFRISCHLFILFKYITFHESFKTLNYPAIVYIVYETYER
jgi:hypothetical protein